MTRGARQLRQARKGFEAGGAQAAAKNEVKEAQQRGYSEAQKAARAAQLATRKRNFDAAVERASYVRVVMLLCMQRGVFMILCMCRPGLRYKYI